MADFVDSKQPVRNDGIYDGSINDEPSSAGVIGSERSASIGVSTSTQRVTAKPGDEDKIALDVSISDGNGNSINKDNPMPVFTTDDPGTEIQDYDLQNAAKDGGEVEHTYVTGSEFRQLNVDCNSAGLALFTLQIEDGVGAGTFSTIMRKFNSVSNPSVSFAHKKPAPIAAGITIKVIKKNLDNQATDMDSLINGVEV